MLILHSTIDVLEFHPFIAVQFFSALLGICRLYTQKFCIFDFSPHSHSFPMVGHFWPKTMSVTNFFTTTWLFRIMPSIFFICVHIPSAIQITKFRTILVKLRFKKNSKRKILWSEMIKDRTRVNLSDKNLGYFS